MYDNVASMDMIEEASQPAAHLLTDWKADVAATLATPSQRLTAATGAALGHTCALAWHLAAFSYSAPITAAPTGTSLPTSPSRSMTRPISSAPKLSGPEHNHPARCRRPAGFVRLGRRP